MWKETTRQQRNRRIFDEELDSFLPGKILDFHVHILNREATPPGESFACGGHPITHYEIEEFAQDLADIYPGRGTSAVCFGAPFAGYDHASNNRYIARACDNIRFFAFRLLDPNEADKDAVRREIIESGFLGLKPYPDFVRGKPSVEIEIVDMLPDWAMEIADDLGLIVMLHIPRPGRLADKVNQSQIAALCQRYRKARIVLAHMGRAYYLNCILGQLDGLKGLPNLYWDLSMVHVWEGMEHLLQNVPHSHVLYATDIPIALAPGKSVEINHQYTYVTPVPWPLSISDDHGKLVFTSFLYEELRAIKKALERLGLGKEFAKDLFFENGARLLNEALKGRSGR